jgi:CheY-like chemotaxis protein
MNGKKVLLIDEEEIILDTYSFLLSKEGYYTVSTNSGREALEKLHQHSFDVVITDFAMKNENGHTVLEEIREMFPFIPVIVLSDKISNTVKQFALLLGARVLVKKPCSYETLISSIRKSFSVNKRYQ